MPKISLQNVDPSSIGKFKSKDIVISKTLKLKEKIYDYLYLMFAHDKHSVLIILQGIDTSGKDGVVRLLFECANPQGIRVFSFKKPSSEELRHDFLWRCHKHTPESGLSVIFNRSYYEEVTTVMVHPELLQNQNLPPESLKHKDFFKRRYQCINDFEKMLTEKGTLIFKFFLHISKDEQKKRLKIRLNDKKRNWKFSESDLKERKHWDAYMESFDKMIQNTSTQYSPWHVIPANNKWYRDYLISQIILNKISKLKMNFPKLPKNLHNKLPKKSFSIR